MEQGPPPPFMEYVLGAAVPMGFVVHQGLVIPLPIYQVLRLAKVQAPPEANHMYQTYFNFKFRFLQERKTTIFKCGLKPPSIRYISIISARSTGSERQVTF